MDNKYVYVFIRQDLTVPQQLVHSSHAVYHMVQQHPELTENNIPSIVVIGIPDLKSLHRVNFKLIEHGIRAYLWEEPDEIDTNLEGTLAIVTVPLGPKEKEALKNYRLYNVVNNKPA